MKMKVGILWQLGLVLAALVDWGSSQATWLEDECKRTLREARDPSVQASRPPKLSGHWTSTGCEIRPGPEFVTRKYFFRRSTFHAQLYYYADEDCSHVTHYISAKGSLRTGRPSWRTIGGNNAKYTLTQIFVIPYTNEKAAEFQKLLHRYCKQSTSNSVKANKKYKIYRFTKYNKLHKERNSIIDDFDCSKIFNFTMNELQLLRVERRYVRRSDIKTGIPRKQAMTELLLGDISTKMKYRRQYRPTYYQTPLQKAKTPYCDVCKKIMNANQWNPPILTGSHVADIDLRGDWVSQRCETRPNGQHLTRHLKFLSSGSLWQGVYEFFKDARCTDPHFRLDVKGTYVKRGQSDVIASANNYIFKTLRLKVTPEDFQMVHYLNSYTGKQCGRAKVWRIGVSQDVTRTKGCSTLGITLPNIEQELMKTVGAGNHDYLYIGQRPSDFASMATVVNRPTSFQGPLVRCSGTTNQISRYGVVHSGQSMAPFVARNTGTRFENSFQLCLYVMTSLIYVIVVL